ncbi:MAG: HAMP domain-containing sensor histidine kinase [Chloroflexota bacterium]
MPSYKDRATDLEMRVGQRAQELAEAYERLQDLDRLKSKFIDDISHELRTPVTNLMLYLDLWERGTPQKQQAYWDVLKKQAGRLAELVEGIIQLSQLELLKGQMSLDLIDFNRLVREVTQTQQFRIQEHDVQMQVTLTDGLPPVWGDKQQLVEMTMHLVGNAINYTPSGTICVQTSFDKETERICLTVQDTGIGIAPEDMPHVFERFYRGRGASQSNKPGVGLGLTVAQEVIQLHRGSITVSSEVGKGSTFYVYLPAHLPLGGIELFIEKNTGFY